MTAYEQIEALVDALSGAALETGFAEDHDGIAFDEADWHVCGRRTDTARTALLAAVKALAEDAERYRWLREHSCQYDSAGNSAESWSTHSDPTSLDAVVDAARSAASAAAESK